MVLAGDHFADPVRRCCPVPDRGHGLTGGGFIDTAAVVFLLNLRPCSMACPSSRTGRNPLARLLMIFWLSDETYSLLTSRKPADPPRVQVAVAG